MKHQKKWFCKIKCVNGLSLKSSNSLYRQSAFIFNSKSIDCRIPVPNRSDCVHLSRIDVEPQQKIERGQQIDLSGNTGGWAGRPHLHFGLSELGVYVNPDLYGLNHSLMTYWNGNSRLDIEHSEMKRRLSRQIAILSEFYDKIAIDDSKLLKKY